MLRKRDAPDVPGRKTRGHDDVLFLRQLRKVGTQMTTRYIVECDRCGKEATNETDDEWEHFCIKPHEQLAVDLCPDCAEMYMNFFIEFTGEKNGN
jgi:hypothetical protein